MKLKYIFFTAILFLTQSKIVLSQEINCNVRIITDQLKNNQLANSQQLFSELQNIITNFMNNRRWSKDEFTSMERINCSLTINIQQATSQGSFVANSSLTITRPVYSASMETQTFRYIDRNFNFNYLANTPLDYNENAFTNNLTQLLAYYANLILAIDYDTFSKAGGNDYVQKMINICNLAPQDGSFAGWKATGGGEDTRNRYWLAENMNSPVCKPMREAQYKYYRMAMDNFAKDPETSKNYVKQVIMTANEVLKLKPTNVYVAAFFESKFEELYQIFSNESPVERQKMFTLLSTIDPTRTAQYRRLL